MLGRVIAVVAAVLVLAALLAASAPPARAHGGGFRDANPDPGPVEPEPAEPPRPPAPVTPSSGKRGRHVLPWTPDWGTWWGLNAGAWDVREGRYRLRGHVAVTPSESDEPDTGAARAGRAGAGEGAEASPAELRTHRLLLERAHTRVVVPYLREVTAPDAGRPTVMVVAALYAWARIARSAEVLSVLEHYAESRDAPPEVRAAAVRSMGSLRRSSAKRPLDVAALSGVRELLLDLHDDATYPNRVRASALGALARLADQPYEEGPLEKDGRSITRALWMRIESPGGLLSVREALVSALGMQPPAGVPSGIISELKRRALTGKIQDGWGGVARASALYAYARLDGKGCLPVIRRAIEADKASRDVSVQAAAFGVLAEIAPQLSSADRQAAAAWIPGLLPDLENEHVRGLAVITLGALLRADLAAGETGVLEDARTGALLMRMVRNRARGSRSYPPLALAVATRFGRPATRPAAVFRTEAWKALAQAAALARGSDAEVAPYIAAAGIARAVATRPVLLKILAGEHRTPRLRGHAARALGTLGSPDERTIELLLEATRDRIHPFLHTQASRALGLLAAPGACDELLAQLEGDPTRGALVVVARSLGYLGDPKAVDRLVGLARNREAGVNVRANAITSLGEILDPEWPRHPSRGYVHAYFPR